jgi:hypothetical protein
MWPLRARTPPGNYRSRLVWAELMTCRLLLVHDGFSLQLNWGGAIPTCHLTRNSQQNRLIGFVFGETFGGISTCRGNSARAVERNMYGITLLIPIEGSGEGSGSARSGSARLTFEQPVAIVCGKSIYFVSRLGNDEYCKRGDGTSLLVVRRRTWGAGVPDASRLC